VEEKGQKSKIIVGCSICNHSTTTHPFQTIILVSETSILQMR
jgi:hypothetical protein